MPTIIEDEKQKAILETFRAGIHALGLAEGNNIGAAKGDIKLTANGPMIGEIAARLSGGYMSGWTYPYSSGAEPIKGAILAAMGRKPEGLIPVKQWTCAERAFISIPGTVKSIIGVEQAQNQPHINDLFLRIKEGDKVSFPENNVSKCGNILAAASERETAVKAGENAARSILIQLDPKDHETKGFLTQRRKDAKGEQGSDYRFPPDAFRLTTELESALTALPDFSLPVNSSLLPDNYSLFPFPALSESNLTDYMGRTVEETLSAVRRLTGLKLPYADKTPEKNADNIVLGRSFWSALIRGAYQGAAYYIENLSA